MEAQLTLEALGTLAGVILFIQIMLKLIVKPLLQSFEDSSHYGLFINLASLALGVGGSCLAHLGEPLTGPWFAGVFFRALEATAFATGGYEVTKNIRAWNNSHR